MTSKTLRAAYNDHLFAQYDRYGFTGCRELIKSMMWKALKTAPANLLKIEVPTNDGVNIISVEFHLVHHYTKDEWGDENGK